jgi:prepilin-type N-terminal cleavage/methylation domain-containing protein
MHSSYKNQRGFTLTEMAIVIVLGGILLAAGLMAGRGQISRAQTQDVLQIIGDLQSASVSFKQRYGALPGDLPNPNAVLAGAVAGTGGTLGNSLIEGAITSPGGLAAAASEAAEATNQLFIAGLIGKRGANVQQYVQSQFGAVHLHSNANPFTAAAYVTANPAVRNVVILYGLPCEVAKEIDLALDDGDVTTGRAQGIAAATPCTAGNTMTRYWVPL